ncbi:hypothetical protein P154DRAFT_485637 [Amniculicola lignicola CBS 123094]|uniref:Zn(2)-C6 fungal-type domain-containing protein n=1 Tax=Amniculicola lignicola CBS 123094 TaxID=1392246 RepID=A0A6A5WSR1_9PLEO|nr:hypothetical protein P154DRAFT_485637 [Amniculicola lignicola CBS 123094]
MAVNGNGHKKGFIRQKAWKPKTKTGCTTCRIRRVKCDETKPDCHRCSSTGRRCDGYPSTALDLLPQTQHMIHLHQSTLASSTSGLGLKSPEEQESFYFYRSHGARELAGFFPSVFWQTEILQASYCVPAIRHAVVALGAMHRKMIDGHAAVVPDDANDKELRFALEHSNRAIQELIRSPARNLMENKITMLACAVIFNCLACLQGHLNVALEHTRSGLKILREIDEELAIVGEEVLEHPISLTALRNMIINMDILARGIMNDDMLAAWEPYPKQNHPARDQPFQSLEDAHRYFQGIFQDVLVFLQNIDLRSPNKAENLKGAEEHIAKLRYQTYSGSYLLEEFLAAPRTPVNEEALTGVQLLHDTLLVEMRAFEDFAGIKTLDVDAQERSLNRIVENSGRLLGKSLSKKVAKSPGCAARYTASVSPILISSKSPKSSARPVFSSNSGVLMALWVVCCRTVKSATRRRVIDMLLENPRREGVWDSILEGLIAVEVMLLEEASSEGAWIMGYNKVRDVCIKYSGLRTARVELRTVTQYQLGQPGVVKEFAW